MGFGVYLSIGCATQAYLQKKDVHAQDDDDAVVNPGYARRELAEPFVVKCWHVTSTDVQSDVTVEWRRKTVEVLGHTVSVPYLSNPKVVQQGSYLKFFRAADTASAAASSHQAAKTQRKA